MKNRKKTQKTSGIIGKKVSSSHLIETEVGPAVHIPSDMFDQEPVSGDMKTEIIPKKKMKSDWNREEINDFWKSLRVNWDDVEGKLLEIGKRPTTWQTINTLASIVGDAVKKGRYQEAKILLESLIQLKTIESAEKTV